MSGLALGMTSGIWLSLTDLKTAIAELLLVYNCSDKI
jgi:hypothetical protein